MDIKTKTIAQAIRLLNATGAQYKIIAPDGQEHGTLEVLRKPLITRRHNHFAKSGFIDRIKACAVAEVLVLDVPDDSTADEFRKAVCSAASRHLGNGNYTTNINGETVELLRIA